MFFAQPAGGAAYPQTTKPGRLRGTGPIIERAIAGKDTPDRKNSCYGLKGRVFVGDEMNGVTEENRIGIVKEGGKIACVSVEEISLRSYLLHAFLRVSEGFF